MASRRTRTDLRAGESSSASQANRGRVMAIFMLASDANEDAVAVCYHYNATHPRMDRRLVEKSEKESLAWAICTRTPSELGECLLGQRLRPRKELDRSTSQRPPIPRIGILLGPHNRYNRSGAVLSKRLCNGIVDLVGHDRSSAGANAARSGASTGER